MIILNRLCSLNLEQQKEGQSNGCDDWVQLLMIFTKVWLFVMFLINCKVFKIFSILGGCVLQIAINHITCFVHVSVFIQGIIHC